MWNALDVFCRGVERKSLVSRKRQLARDFRRSDFSGPGLRDVLGEDILRRQRFWNVLGAYQRGGQGRSGKLRVPSRLGGGKQGRKTFEEGGGSGTKSSRKEIETVRNVRRELQSSWGPQAKKRMEILLCKPESSAMRNRTGQGEGEARKGAMGGCIITVSLKRKGGGNIKMKNWFDRNSECASLKEELSRAHQRGDE